MELQSKLKLLEHADHVSHKVTLWLVALSLVALVIGKIHPSGREAEGLLYDVLHAVHWLALTIVVIYLGARRLLERNVGKELAALMAQRPGGPEPDSTEDPPPSDTPETTGKTKRSKRLSISPENLAFVSRTDDAIAKSLFEMNLEGFEQSAFEMSRERVIRRNSDLIARNPNAFLMLRDPARQRTDQSDDAAFIGYTCVLPLNPIGADVYLRGLIKDKDLPASLVCGPGEATGAILVFAIVLNPRAAGAGSLKGKYFGFLLKALEHHVAAIARAHPPATADVAVWTQSEHPFLERILKERGFSPSQPPRRSADGYALLRHAIPPATGSPSA